MRRRLLDLLTVCLLLVLYLAVPVALPRLQSLQLVVGIVVLALLLVALLALLALAWQAAPRWVTRMRTSWAQRKRRSDISRLKAELYRRGLSDRQQLHRMKELRVLGVRRPLP